MARGIPRPVNDRIADALNMRQIELVRLANGTTADLVAGPMRRADERIAGILTGIADTQRLTPTQTQRVIDRINVALDDQNAQLRAAVNGYVRDVAIDEEVTQNSMLIRAFTPLASVAAAGAAIASVSIGTVVGATRRAPIRGAKLPAWLNQLFRNDKARVGNQVRSGIIDGLNSTQLSRAVVGTAANGFKDGVRETSRRGLATLLQTSTTHASAQSREQVFMANPELITSERWTATLDSRTCVICMALDGKVFPVGEGIMPPAHPNCRCQRLPIIPGLQALPVDDTQFLPQTVQDSFDGSGPQVLTYTQWLRTQSAKVQRNALGASRFKLFQEGVTPDQFVNDRGRVLTLPELKRKMPTIFDEAGL